MIELIMYPRKESIVKARMMLSSDRQLTGSQDVIRIHYATSRSFGLPFVPPLRSSRWSPSLVSAIWLHRYFCSWSFWGYANPLCCSQKDPRWCFCCSSVGHSLQRLKSHSIGSLRLICCGLWDLEPERSGRSHRSTAWYISVGGQMTLGD